MSDPEALPSAAKECPASPMEREKTNSPGMAVVMLDHWDVAAPAVDSDRAKAKDRVSRVSEIGLATSAEPAKFLLAAKGPSNRAG
jgi:hypothetical protein